MSKTVTTPTVVTKQLYRLIGNKKTDGTFEAEVIDTLDENNNQVLCREIINGDKHFNILIKNAGNKIYDQEMADMIEPNNDVMGVSYLKTDDDDNMYFVRYLDGDHTDPQALEGFFAAVQERIKKATMFRSWTIDSVGVLTKKKNEYFY